MPGEVAPEQMKPGAIYNSNRFFMRASCWPACGCEVNDLGIVPDDRDATIAAHCAMRPRPATSSSRPAACPSARKTTSSPRCSQLGELAAVVRSSMKPGKPFAYGSIGGGQGACHFIGLPGNPVSSFVTFLMLVRPFPADACRAPRCCQRPKPMQLRADFDWKRAPTSAASSCACAATRRAGWSCSATRARACSLPRCGPTAWSITRPGRPSSPATP
jgi:molybdopterin molybdotransferase